MSVDIKIEKLINNIFFTEKDNSIYGSTQRDPLGLQPIWSYYGRKVINHLTTISTTIHGFREVLLCISICSSVKESNKDLNYSDLILLFEQLFIYTSISKGRLEGILGADNGNVKYSASDGNPIISSEETILVREISLGYYGRYKTPLSTMGILNKKSELKFTQEDIISNYGEVCYSSILKAFTSFSLSKNKKFESFSAKDELYKAVFGKFRKGEEKFWLEHLYKFSDKENDLMKLSYQKANSFKTGKDFFYNLPKERKEVQDILKLEPFLRCMEEVFYKCLNSKSIKDISIDNYEEHLTRYEKFCTISTFESQLDNSLFTSRMKFLKDNCSPASENYKENIIEYHKLVCKQKKSSNWLEMDSDGRIQSFVNADVYVVDIFQWDRDYYFSSLASIKSEIMEFSK